MATTSSSIFNASLRNSTTRSNSTLNASSQQVASQLGVGHARARRCTSLSLLTSLLCLSGSVARSPGATTLRRAPQPVLRALNTNDHPKESFADAFSKGSAPWLDFGVTQCPALVTVRDEFVSEEKNYTALAFITPKNCAPSDKDPERILVRQNGNSTQESLAFDGPIVSASTESAFTKIFASSFEEANLPKDLGVVWQASPFYVKEDLPSPGNITLSPLSFPGSGLANSSTTSTGANSPNRYQIITVPLIISEKNNLVLELPPSIRFSEPVVLVDNNGKVLSLLMPNGDSEITRRLPVLTVENTSAILPAPVGAYVFIGFLLSLLLCARLYWHLTLCLCEASRDTTRAVVGGLVSGYFYLVDLPEILRTHAQGQVGRLLLSRESQGVDEQSSDIENQLQAPTPMNRFTEDMLNRFIAQPLTRASAKVLVGRLNQLVAQGRVDVAAQFLHPHASSDNFNSILAWLKPELVSELVSMSGLLQRRCDYPTRQVNFHRYLVPRSNAKLAPGSAEDHEALRDQLKPYARNALIYSKQFANHVATRDALYETVAAVIIYDLEFLTSVLNLEALRDLTFSDIAVKPAGSKDHKSVASGIISLFDQLETQDNNSPWHITAALCAEESKNNDITKMIERAKEVVNGMVADDKGSNPRIFAPKLADAGMAGLAQILPYLERLAQESPESTVYQLATLIRGFNHCATGGLEGISAVQQAASNGQATLENENLSGVVRTVIAQAKQSAFARLKDIRKTLGREAGDPEDVNDVHFVRGLSHPVNQLVGLPVADYEDPYNSQSDNKMALTQAQYAALFNASTLCEQFFKHFELMADQQVTIDMATATPSEKPELIEQQKANRAKRPILARTIFGWAQSHLHTKLFGGGATQTSISMTERVEREERVTAELAEKFDIQLDDMGFRLSLSPKTAWAILQAMKYIKSEYRFETSFQPTPEPSPSARWNATVDN